MNNNFSFRGSPFINRYRITGALTTKSPLHIGNGMPRPADGAEKKLCGSEEMEQISDVVRDFDDKPYLPGSSLKGAMRMYLLHIFQGFSANIATNNDWHDENWIGEDSDQAAKNKKLQGEGSMLEKLFGTAIHAGKIDFWDAPLAGKAADNADFNGKKGWSDKRQTYFTQSVAIDPMTGAAEAHKLYSFDLVPEGARFSFNITGQNLSDEELGLLYFGLHAFNSEIYPVTLGAMGGRGFGRFKMELADIYCLKNEPDELKNWAKIALEQKHAGFQCIPRLPKNSERKMIEKFKEAFNHALSQNTEA